MHSLGHIRLMNREKSPEEIDYIILKHKVKMLREFLDWNEGKIEAWCEELRQFAKDSAS